MKTISRFARELQPNITSESYNKINGNKLYSILRDKNILIEIDNQNKNVPSDKVIDAGLFTKEKVYFEKENKSRIVAYLTDKGEEWLKKTLEKHDYIKFINKENKIKWIECDVLWVLNNFDMKRFTIQYKNKWGNWDSFTEGSQVITLINAYKNINKFRYAEK